MHSTPMLFVRDVRASAAWYGGLLGVTSDHDRDDFDRIIDGDNVLLMLHRWDHAEHGMPARPADAETGLGIMVWITVPDLDRVHAKARDMGTEIVSEPQRNPLAGWREFTLRDPDGYLIAFVAW